MSSYFPYNEDEWEKIVEQAFAADAAEPQFSKAYQRRKHRMVCVVNRCDPLDEKMPEIRYNVL